MKKRIVAVISAVLIFALSFSFLCFAETVPDHRLVPRMNDQAELVDSTTESELLKRLDELSESLSFDIAIATVKTTDGKDIIAFSDDYFDYNGFGMGEDKSGVVLVISMDPRECYISASGEGTKHFDYGDCQNIIDDFYDDLKAGNYGSVFGTFIDDVEQYIDIGRNGKSVSYRLDSMKINWKLAIALPIAIGIILAFVTVKIMTRNLTSVSKKTGAADYQVKGSLSLSRNDEHFLYKNVTKTPIQSDNSSSGSGGTNIGSSGTHISSSGNSHSGGGRSF